MSWLCLAETWLNLDSIMAWRNLTTDDLLLKISGPELDGFRGAALEQSPTQGDPIAGVINQVVTTARSLIARNLNNVPMGAGITLPEALIGPAVDIIILAIMSRAAGTVIDEQNFRRVNANRAWQIFNDVAQAKLIVEAADPNNLDTTVLGYSKPSFNTCGFHRGFGRRAEREF
jgi:hypothetical protein